MDAETSRSNGSSAGAPVIPFSANGASASGASANGASAGAAFAHRASANGATPAAASNVAVGRRDVNGRPATAVDIDAAALTAAASGGAARGASQQMVASASGNGVGKALGVHLASAAEVDVDGAVVGMMGACEAGHLESCAYERCA